MSREREIAMTQEKNRDYTDFMKAKFDQQFSDIRNFYYAREDLEAALKVFDSVPPDAKPFRRTLIQDICTAWGIDTNLVIKDRSLLDQVPTRAQMEGQILDGFHSMYRDFPTSADFMERMVRALAPEYGADSVRLAILKKFLAGAGPKFKLFKTERILKSQEEKLTEQEKKYYFSLSDEAKKSYLISKVDESIFDQVDGTANAKVNLGADDTLELIAGVVEKHSNASDWTIQFSDLILSEKTLKTLDGFLKQQDLKEKMEGLKPGEKVSLLAQSMKTGQISREKIRETEDLISEIEADFRKQLAEIPRKTINGKEDTAESVYKDAKKTRKKTLQSRSARKNQNGQQKNTDPELLKICNDFADGRFRGTKMTREYLYYFAFMFGMRWSPEEDNERSTVEMSKDEKERWIRSDLNTFFQDYYNDNLMRYFSADYAKNSRIKSQLESEPSGRGINYKNYKEAIYLWFLCHDDMSLCPGEKIDRAIACAAACQKKAADDRAKDESERARNEEGKKESWDQRQVRLSGMPTLAYIDPHVGAVMRLLNIDDEKEIVKFVTENFAMPDPNGVNSAQILVASQQNTARKDMHALTKEIGESFPNQEETIAWKYGAEEDTSGSESDFDSEDFRDAEDSPTEDFLWRLRKRFPDDAAFLQFLNILDEKLHRSGRGGVYTERCGRMLAVLRALVKFSVRKTGTAQNKKTGSMEDVLSYIPLSAQEIQEYMKRDGIKTTIAGRQLQDALSDLTSLGFDIRRETDEKTSKQTGHYYLGTLTYQEDPELTELVRSVKTRYVATEEPKEQLLALFLRNLNAEGSVTRYELIATQMQLYPALLSEHDTDDEGLSGFEGRKGSFAGVLQDYRRTVDKYLTEGGFQPLSEKNVFDLFVILSLYFYLVKNYGMEG